MLLDFIAQRYGKLPSDVLRFGTTLDIDCANLAVTYEAHIRKKTENGEVSTKHTTTELQAMVDAVKGMNK